MLAEISGGVAADRASVEVKVGSLNPGNTTTAADLPEQSVIASHYTSPRTSQIRWQTLAQLNVLGTYRSYDKLSVHKNR